MNQSLDQVLNLYKKKSETPLQTTERYAKANPAFSKVKMTYAGRLDPMAEGVLVVLTGEKNKEREAYTGLDKDYEFEFMLGIDTDTHDVLGKIVSQSDVELADNKVESALMRYTGKFNQKYPAYSSKVVNGSSLFDWARRGKIGSILIPDHEVEVKKIQLIGTEIRSRETLAQEIDSSIAVVSGDFRQQEIRKIWNKYFEQTTKKTFKIYKAKVSCGSGFYVRQLVSDLGKDLGTGAVTIKILRTRVGKYNLEDSIK